MSPSRPQNTKNQALENPFSAIAVTTTTVGMLVDGQWQRAPEADPAFLQRQSHFRERPNIPSHRRERYLLHVSPACPWAHRTAIAHTLLGMDDFVELREVAPAVGDRGWRLREGGDLVDVYLRSAPGFTGPVTLPVLSDPGTQRIINNDARDILGIFNDIFAPAGGSNFDLFPEPRRRAIDTAIEAIDTAVSLGVYRCGFAQTQAAYDAATSDLFRMLARLEVRLGKVAYLCGPSITAADVCLFTTLVRFDPVYRRLVGQSQRRLSDFPALSAFVDRIHRTPGIAETVHLGKIRNHYELTPALAKLPLLGNPSSCQE